MKNLELTSKNYVLELTEEEAAVFGSFGKYGNGLADWISENFGQSLGAKLALNPDWDFSRPDAKILRFTLSCEIDTPEMHQKLMGLLQDFLDRDQAALTGIRRDALPPMVHRYVEQAKVSDKEVLKILLHSVSSSSDGNWRQDLYDFTRHVIGNRTLRSFNDVSQGLWNDMREAGWSAADAITPAMKLVRSRSSERLLPSAAEDHIRQAIIASRSEATPRV